MALLVAVASGYALALVAPPLHRLLGRRTGWALAALPADLAVWFGAQVPAVREGAVRELRLPWVPDLDVSLALRLDGLSLLFALVITAVGAPILVYAASYLAGHPQLGRAQAFLLAFMASMLGLVLADDVVTLFVFWELTSVFSWLLIGLPTGEARTREAAAQAFLVTSLGAQALLAGVVLLHLVAGTPQLSGLPAAADTLRASALYVPVVLLLALGAFTKSAQWPFHFWLPDAMVAPTPVSAYLHAATMVTAGVYLLARLAPTLGGTPLWTLLLTGAGALTMVFGGLWSLVQTDLKALLAYATISVLGLLVLLIGVGTEEALLAMAAYLVVHALYKASLFTAAGHVSEETGTRDVRRLAGLGRIIPWTAAAALLAAGSMAGLPPFVGFAGKEAVYAAVRSSPGRVAAVAFSLALLVGAAGVMAIGPFFGTPAGPPRPRRAGALWGVPLVLAVAGLVLGLAPSWVEAVAAPAASTALGGAVRAALHAVPEPRPELWLSLASLAGGVLLWSLRRPLRRAAAPMRSEAHAPGGYEAVERAFVRGAARITARLQSGSARSYLRVTLAAATFLLGAVVVKGPGLRWPEPVEGFRLYDVLLLGLVVAATAGVVVTRRLLHMVVALGTVGFAVAMLFVRFGAPDVALAQFLVETLAAILLVLVARRIRQSAPRTRRPSRARDAVVAGAAGLLLAALVIMVGHHPAEQSISEVYAQKAVPEGRGQNVVTVILVDFRALDTLGEITVLATAALGVSALAGRRKKAQR